MKFAAARAFFATLTIVALFPGCWLVVGDLPPPLPEEEAMAGATGSSAGGTGGAQASGGSAGSIAGGTPSDPCDRDADGHDDPNDCGGDDCDDEDPDVHPMQSKHFGGRQPNVDYDYDCDGKPEQEQTKAIVCSALPVGDCATDEGFLDTLPACGDAGVWGRCTKQAPLNTCVNHEIDTERVMKCQ